MIFIPGVGERDWLWEHQREYLQEVVQSQVIGLDDQETRAELVDYVLAHAPATFSLAGHSLGGWHRQSRHEHRNGCVRCSYVTPGRARTPAAIEYIMAFCRHIAADYEGALDQHFGEFLHEERYVD